MRISSVMVCAAILLSVSAELTAQPDSARIAYVSRVSGQQDIWVMDANGSAPRRLTRGGSNYAPAWSPDGSIIAFNSHRNGGWKIWLMDPDGRDVRRLTGSSTGPFNYEYLADWSPDGRRVLMEKWDNQRHNFEVHVVNFDGSDERNLTSHSAHDRQPTWSPHGDKILFTSKRDGNEELYVMSVDGSSIKNLTRNAATDFAGAWSPDGQTILFHSNRDGKFRSYLMDADGKNVRPLPGVGPEDHLQNWTATDSNTDSIPFRALRAAGSVWNRDGTAVLIHSVRNGNRDLYWINVANGERTRLTKHQADEWLGAYWSP